MTTVVNFSDKTSVLRFPLPDIPKGWTPNPRHIWELEKNKENLNETEEPRPDPNQAQTHAQWKQSQLSADKVSLHILRLRVSEDPDAIHSVVQFWARRLCHPKHVPFSNFCPKRIGSGFKTSALPFLLPLLPSLLVLVPHPQQNHPHRPAHIARQVRYTSPTFTHPLQKQPCKVSSLSPPTQSNNPATPHSSTMPPKPPRILLKSEWGQPQDKPSKNSTRN